MHPLTRPRATLHTKSNIVESVLRNPPPPPVPLPTPTSERPLTSSGGGLLE